MAHDEAIDIRERGGVGTKRGGKDFYEFLWKNLQVWEKSCIFAVKSKMLHQNHQKVC